MEKKELAIHSMFIIPPPQIKNPTKATYFTNRALCHLKLKRWEQSCQDCRRALDMDSDLIKGHFFLGQSLLELEYYDEAIKHLQRGIFLANPWSFYNAHTLHR